MIPISSLAPRKCFAWPKGRPLRRLPMRSISSWVKRGVIRDVGLVLLAHHHVGRVVQHALNEHAARRGHDHGRVRVLAHHDGQTADVVQMAVRDDDQIEGEAAQLGKIRRGGPADFLRIQAAIDQNIEVAELDEQRIGTNAAVAVQVSKFHERVRENEKAAKNEDEVARLYQSRGTVMSNAGRITWIFRPNSSTPWKLPCAWASVPVT